MGWEKVVEKEPPPPLRLERVMVDAELLRKLMAPLAHRCGLGDVVSVLDMEKPFPGRALVVHESADQGHPVLGTRSPGAWFLAVTGEVGAGTLRKELMEGVLVIDAGKPAIALAITGEVIPLPAA